MGARCSARNNQGWLSSGLLDSRMRYEPVVPMRPVTDKRSWLQTVALIIKNGTVHFPRTEYKELLGQIFNLGGELRDDLCDGHTTLLQGLMDQEL